MSEFNRIFYVVGVLAALWSGIYLTYEGARRLSGLWRSARIVYLSIAGIEYYHAVIYALVLFGLLPISSYGQYLRPLVSLFLIAPFLIAVIHHNRIKSI